MVVVFFGFSVPFTFLLAYLSEEYAEMKNVKNFHNQVIML